MSGPETAGTGPHQAHAGLLEKLMAAVRPEFRARILTFAPGDPVFGLGGACRIPQCGRPARPSGGSLCNSHYDRWAASGRPDLDTWTAGPEAAQPWYGHTPPASCQVSGCRFGAMQRGLCNWHASAWKRAGRPGTASWLAGVALPENGPDQRGCVIDGCGLWAQPAYAEGLCARHGRRWRDNGRPDLASFAQQCDAPDDRQQADLSGLPRQLRLELQYALQGRADDRTVKVNPVVLRALVRYLAASGASSLLDRSEQEWRGDPPAASAKQAVALLAYAHRAITTLAEGEGWDAEYPRDTWHLRRLGTGYDTAVLDFTGISQPWLRDLAKRWTRWRITTGRARVTYGAGVRAVTRLSAFLDGTRTDSPGLLTRDVLERYLADLHRELAGRAVTHRQYVSHVGSLLLDARRHQWEPALHPSAMLYPEDYPKRPRPLPRALAGHVTAQLEDPVNLGKWQNPAYRLITVILMRCGLRVTDGTAIPSGCVVRDAADAPYLRYYNNKMEREALVPIDDEVAALVAAQEERNRQRWPQGTPVLFPRPDANIDGTRPVRGDTYRRALYRWLGDCDIRDEHGQPARLTPHQWRHTLGTWLKMGRIASDATFPGRRDREAVGA